MQTAMLSPTAAGAPAGGADPSARDQSGSGIHRNLALAVGLATGLLSLTGMARLAAGAFSGPMSRVAWMVVLAAMLPWVVYLGSRARHGRLSRGQLLLVSALVAVGAVSVWLAVLGPVVALVCSLAASVVIWVSDWPVRRPRGADRLVRFEELQHDEDA